MPGVITGMIWRMREICLRIWQCRVMAIPSPLTSSRIRKRPRPSPLRPCYGL